MSSFSTNNASAVDGPLNQGQGAFSPGPKFSVNNANAVSGPVTQGGPGFIPGPFPPAPIPGPVPPITVINSPPVAGGFVAIPANGNGTVSVALDPAVAVTSLTIIVPSLNPGQSGFITITNASLFAIAGIAFQGGVSGALPSALVAGASITLGWNGATFMQVA